MALKFLQKHLPLADSWFSFRPKTHWWNFRRSVCVRKHWRAIRTREHRNTKKSHTRSLAKRLRLNSRLARPGSRRLYLFPFLPPRLAAGRHRGERGRRGKSYSHNGHSWQPRLRRRLERWKAPVACHLWGVTFTNLKCRWRRAQVKRSLTQTEQDWIILHHVPQIDSLNN